MQSLGHMTQGLKYDWPKEYVPQKMRFVPQNATQFNKFPWSNSYSVFEPNLYPNRAFVPQFSLNLVNFLEISKLLAL